MLIKTELEDKPLWEVNYFQTEIMYKEGTR